MKLASEAGGSSEDARADDSERLSRVDPPTRSKSHCSHSDYINASVGKWETFRRPHRRTRTRKRSGGSSLRDSRRVESEDLHRPLEDRTPEIDSGRSARESRNSLPAHGRFWIDSSRHTSSHCSFRFRPPRKTSAIRLPLARRSRHPRPSASTPRGASVEHPRHRNSSGRAKPASPLESWAILDP